MSLFKVGRLCLKLAGRDSNRKCVVVEQVDENYVLVDGNVRRKKVNIKHLEPLANMVEINAGASHDEVKTAFKTLGLESWDKKAKKVAERPRKQRKVKKQVEEKKVTKKVEKKAEVKVEAKAEPVKEVIEETSEKKE